jgi:AcrR family transcriptional regulator
LQRPTLSKRQRAIVDAAKQLMSTEDVGFSMRQLAEAAGVSPATPYNLFGAKRSILAVALEEDFEDFLRSLERLDSGDAIDRFFEASRVASDAFFSKPRFYRAAYAVVTELDPAEFRERYMPPRFALWLNLTAQAAAQGFLRPEVNPALLAGLLIGLFDVVIRNWLRDDFGPRRFDAEAGYALASGLASASTPAARERLEGLMALFQGQIELLAPDLREEPAPGRAVGA